MSIVIVICLLFGFVVTGICLFRVSEEVRGLAAATSDFATVSRNVSNDLIDAKKKTQKDIDGLIEIVERECRINIDAQTQIDAIVDRLEDIAEDIRRIDADEKEIRRYYCNFREPAAGGVGWAKDYPAEDIDELADMAIEAKEETE